MTPDERIDLVGDLMLAATTKAIRRSDKVCFACLVHDDREPSAFVALDRATGEIFGSCSGCGADRLDLLMAAGLSQAQAFHIIYPDRRGEAVTLHGWVPPVTTSPKVIAPTPTNNFPDSFREAVADAQQNLTAWWPSVGHDAWIAESIDWLTRRGLMLEDVKMLGLGLRDVFPEGRDDREREVFARRVLFPYRSLSGDLVQMQSRGPTDQGYSNASGAKRAGWINADNRTTAGLLVEGAFDAVVPGRSGITVGVLQGGTLSREDANDIAERFDAVVIAMDRDDQGRRHAERIISRLHDVEVHVALGGAEPGDDLGDLLAPHAPPAGLRTALWCPEGKTSGVSLLLPTPLPKAPRNWHADRFHRVSKCDHCRKRCGYVTPDGEALCEDHAPAPKEGDQ